MKFKIRQSFFALAFAGSLGQANFQNQSEAENSSSTASSLQYTQEVTSHSETGTAEPNVAEEIQSPYLDPNAMFIEPSSHNIQQDLIAIAQNNNWRSPAEIQKELSAIAGDGHETKWENGTLRGTFKLTHIATHLQDLNNELEVLYFYSFFGKDFADKNLTHFTNKIFVADEQRLISSIMIAKEITASESEWQINEDSRFQYKFKFETNEFEDNFSLHEPKASHELLSPDENSFDPIGQLGWLSKNFENTQEYQFETEINGKTHSVTITPRQRNNDQLTIEVELQAVTSLIKHTFVLIYQRQ